MARWGNCIETSTHTAEKPTRAPGKFAGVSRVRLADGFLHIDGMKSASPPPEMGPEPEYRLVETPGGCSVGSVATGETFHPVAGPETEARVLYLNQLNLVERARQAAREGVEFVLWDVGLGAGGNICTVLRALRETGARLRVVSFDHTLAPMEFALAHVGQLPFLRGFDAVLRDLIVQREVSLSGCGIKGGSVYGKTDADGHTVAEGEVGAPELFATIFQALGIDHQKHYYLGARPIPLTDPNTKPITQVLA